MTSSSSSMFSVERRNFTDLVIVQTHLYPAPYITALALPRTLILSHQLLISLLDSPPVPRVCLQMSNQGTIAKFSSSTSQDPTCLKVSVSRLFHKQMSRVCVSNLTIIDRTPYLPSTPENCSPSKNQPSDS